MPFNPDDFAPKPSGFNPDEFLPSEKSGFNPDEFLPKEQAQAFNPDGFLPVTQNDFKAALGNIRDVVVGAVKEQVRSILPPASTPSPLVYEPGADPFKGMKELGQAAQIKGAGLEISPEQNKALEDFTVENFKGIVLYPAAITGAAQAVGWYIANKTLPGAVRSAREAVTLALRRSGVPEAQASRMADEGMTQAVAKAQAAGAEPGIPEFVALRKAAQRGITPREGTPNVPAPAEPVAQPARPVEEPLFPVEAKAPETAPAPAKRLTGSPEREAMLDSQIETAKSALVERPTAPVEGWKSEPVQGGGTSLESPGGYRVFVPEGQDPAKAAAAIREIERAEYGASQIPEAQAPIGDSFSIIEKEAEKIGELQEKIKSKAMTYQGELKDTVGKAIGVPPENLDLSYNAWAQIRDAYTSGNLIKAKELADKFNPKPQPPIETPLFEGEQYAQKTGAQVEGAGQEVAPVERTGTGVYLRDTAKDGMEAAKGEVISPPSEPPPPTPPVAEKPMSEPKKTNPRGFINTVKESGMTTEGLKEEVLGIKPQDYEQLPNADVLKGADDVIAKKGTVKALEELMANENPSIEDTAVAIRLMKIYENRGDYDKVIPLIDKFDSVFRKSGRTVQLASLWNRLTPSGFSKTIERTLEKLGVKIDEDFKKVLIKKMEEIKRMPEGPDRTQATFELLNSVYDKVPFVAKAENLIDAYRYTNMLSSPLTHERNLYGNTMQTFLTRPLDMIGEWTYDMARHPFNPIARDIKLLDIPKYYQSVFKTIPEAGAAFLKALGSNSVSTKVVESPTEGVNFINEAMRANLPKALRVIPNLMEASDRFFGILVAAGEKARLMRGGMAEAEAEIKAKELAEKILYRQRLGGMKKGEGPVLVRALDELGKIVLSARNYPVIGKPISWFAPFVTTPINIAKASVERSPFGFFGGKYDDEQMGKALIGSLVALLGLSMSLAGKVVWMPPRSKKGKTAFYESGRLPLSVEVGGKYIPAWYFGPYALSFMLPEAFRYQMQENEKKLTPNNMAAIAKAVVASGRLITEQTPMAGVKDLTAIATGESTLSSEIVARPASQMMPFVGALRFVANIVDPIYRDGDGLVDELKKSVPTLTKDLEAYKKLDGTPSTRSLSSLYLPYAINERDARADMAFRGIMERERRKSIQREKRKKLREGE